RRARTMLLMIDNYDSFTYNLVQYLGELGADVHVQRNDAITLEQIAAWQPEKIVISPGPCRDLSGADRALRRQDTDTGRLPGPPGNRTGVRWTHRAGTAGDAWKSLNHNARRGRSLRRPRESADRYPLSFAGYRARVDAGLPGGHRDQRRRRDHG